jgi:tetratricopeptide (TPR) repeat protein
VLVLYPLGDNEGTVVSLTTLQAPGKATRKFERAQKELNKKNPNLKKAAANLEAAVEIYPEFAGAWTLLGEVRLKGNDLTAAKDAFQQSIEADPQFLPPYSELAAIHGREGAWDSLAIICKKWLQLKTTTLARYYLALANVELRRIDEAEEALVAVVESPEVALFPQAHHLLGLIYLRRGDTNSAAEQYREFLALAPESPMAAEVSAQLRQWEVEGVLASQETRQPIQPLVAETAEPGAAVP